MISSFVLISSHKQYILTGGSVAACPNPQRHNNRLMWIAI